MRMLSSPKTSESGAANKLIGGEWFEVGTRLHILEKFSAEFKNCLDLVYPDIVFALGKNLLDNMKRKETL